ncbi:MAG: DUF1295 domain-containing protein [Candidatus Heimdallarchaeota archaeon]|nr:DUF1295 domain-containing protein [Candidatus Heimdallarchaeota archaeon]
MKNNSIVDIGWGLGFVVLAISTYLNTSTTLYQQIIYTAVIIWGGRLALHLLLRSIGKPEDFRYAQMRKKWGSKATRNAYILFLIQGMFIYVISLPFMQTGITSFTWINYLGILIFLIGFGIESFSDYQLRRFKKSNGPESVLSTGLWSISRHPNYFGESMVWWGIFLSSITSFSSIYMIFSPIVVTLLVRYVSGTPIIEKRYMDNIDYQEYARKTPIFTPLLSKRG